MAASSFARNRRLHGGIDPRMAPAAIHANVYGVAAHHGVLAVTCDQ